MAPFRWPTTANDLVLATEVAARRPSFTTDWEAIAKILSAVFSTEEKSIEITGRSSRERMDRLLNKFQNSFSVVETKNVLLNVQNELHL